MRMNDTLILLSPVALAVVAMVLLLLPGFILPAAPPLEPVAGAPPPPGAASPAASPVAGAQAGSSNTGGSGAPAATAVPTSSQAGGAAAQAGGAGNPERGKQLFTQRGCGACHVLAAVPGAVGATGPELNQIATVAATRKPGVDAEAYIRESIVNPAAFTAPGFPAGVMPANLVTGQDLDDVVALLLQQQ
jgi:cytochrome c551/c552